MVASRSCVFQFSLAQVLVGLRKQFINNFVFPTSACAAGFNNNNNNNNNNDLLLITRHLYVLGAGQYNIRDLD